MKEELEKAKRLLETLKQSIADLEKRIKHMENIANGKNVITPDWRK